MTVVSLIEVVQLLAITEPLNRPSHDLLAPIGYTFRPFLQYHWVLHLLFALWDEKLHSEMTKISFNVSSYRLDNNNQSFNFLPLQEISKLHSTQVTYDLNQLLSCLLIYKRRIRSGNALLKIFSVYCK